MNLLTKSPNLKSAHNRVIAGLLACGLLLSLTAPSASAEEVDAFQNAEQIANHVSEVAPGNAIPVTGVRSEDAFELEAGAVTATVPVSGDEAIDVMTLIGDKDLQAEISLPADLSLGEGVLTSDGTVVYTSESDAEAVAIQTLPGGETRIQTVLSGPNSQHEFGYGMDGYRATIDSEGNAAFIAVAPEGAYVPVDAAWAVDANGEAVETYYEVRGDELFQVVVPDADTAYPVVADPTWGWRNAAWGLTLTRSETASIKDYAAAAGFCAALVRNHGLTIACGVWASYLQVQAATANNASPRQCLHVVVLPVPGYITRTYC